MGNPDDLEIVAKTNAAAHEKDAAGEVRSTTSIDEGKVYAPDDSLDEYVHPDLKDYPVPLVAKTVALHNDPT